MAQVDAGIYQNLLGPPKSVLDYQAQYAAADQAKTQNLLGQMQVQQGQQALQDDQATRAFFAGGGTDPNKLMAVAPKAGQALQKAQLDAKKTQADIGLTTAKTGESTAQTAKSQFELQLEKVDKSITDIASYQNPQQALAQLQQHMQSGDIDPQKGALIQQQLQGIQSPDQFNAWKGQMLSGIVDAKTQLTLKQQKDIADQSNATSISNNAMTNATSRANAQLQASTSRSNNAANIAKDYKVAGLDAMGNMTSGDGSGTSVSGLTDAIGTGKVPLSVALSRTPPAMKAQVMADLASRYPDYDPTDMAQRNRAAVAFGTGPQGNSVRSFNVSLSHLDTLGNLADALNNGNIQLVNKVGNIYTQQTGSPAPTNFEAAKKIVTDEIVKAIVGGGGGVHDREEAASTISKASSPAQLSGVIDTYKELMRGQLGGLERQYQATTGRGDFRTKFLSPQAQGATGTVNNDLHTQADAILRGGK